jgi:hypothetical protein
LIYATPEVRDLFHRLASTKLQHTLAQVEFSLASEGKALLIESVTGSEILIKVTDSLVFPVPHEKELSGRD